MSTIKAGRDIAPFGVRIPVELKEKLQKFADKNGRSLNAEILYRLENSLSDKNYTEDDVMKYVDAALNKFEDLINNHSNQK